MVIWHSYQCKHNGRLLKALLKMYDDKANKLVLGEIQAVTDELQWTHISKQLERLIVGAYPINYPLF